MVREEVKNRIMGAIETGENAVKEADELISFAKRAGIDISKQEAALIEQKQKLSTIKNAASDT